MLIAFTSGRRANEFLFSTRSGKVLLDGYIHRHIMTPTGVPGMHSLRRYRATWADERGCPRSLLTAWLGHRSGDGEIENSHKITDLYIKSAENQVYRRLWVENIGTGLEIAAATSPALSKITAAKPRKPRKTVVAEAEPLAQLAAF
jgi:hypothetical protein